MDWGCCKWSRDIIQALIGAQLVGMCLSEHIFTSEFTTQTPRPETDAARRGGIAQAGLHLRCRDKQNSKLSLSVRLSGAYYYPIYHLLILT